MNRRLAFLSDIDRRTERLDASGSEQKEGVYREEAERSYREIANKLIDNSQIKCALSGTEFLKLSGPSRQSHRRIGRASRQKKKY